MQRRHAPQKTGDGDEMDFTMWMGPVAVRRVAQVEDVSPAGFQDRRVLVARS